MGPERPDVRAGPRTDRIVLDDRESISNPAVCIAGQPLELRVAAFEKRTLRFVKGDELLGLEDALLPLVQQLGLRVPNEPAEELVVRFPLRGKALEPVPVLRSHGYRGESHGHQ